MGPWIPVSGMPDSALLTVSASWGSCVSAKNKNSFQRSRNTFKLLFKSKIKVEINHVDHEFQFPKCLIPHFFPFLQVEAVACLEKKNNNSIQRARNTFKLLFKSKIKIEINHWDHKLQFPECLIPHFSPFLQFEAVACLQKTIIYSNVLGIPSSYFSNQRKKVKLTNPTTISSFRNAWFRTFFSFLQAQAVACQEKNTNSIQHSRNTFKLLFKLKIKVEINYWDHEFQFPECLIPHFFPFLKAQAVACQEKNINSSPMFSEYLQVTFQNQRLALKLTIGTMNSSFRNAWFRTFFQFLQAQAVACQEKKTLILSKVLGIPSSYFSKSKINVEINHWDHEFQFPECLIPHFFPFL